MNIDIDPLTCDDVFVFTYDHTEEVCTLSNRFGKVRVSSETYKGMYP